MEPPIGICGCENTSFGATIVKIGAIVAEISRFFSIFKMAAVVQNLVGIDAAGLILLKF